MDRRPGVAYRRPDGDPTITVEAAGESRLNTDALPQTDWLRVVEPDDRDRLRDALDGDAVDVTYRLTVDGESAWVHERGARDEAVISSATSSLPTIGSSVVNSSNSSESG